MMGAFWLATAYSEVLAAQFGKLASVEIPEGGTLDYAAASAGYVQLFELMAAVGIGSGLLMALAVPLLRRGMHGVR